MTNSAIATNDTTKEISQPAIDATNAKQAVDIYDASNLTFMHDDDDGDDSELTFAELFEQYSFSVPRRGQLLEGQVLTISDSSILIDVGAKRDAVVPAQDLSQVDAEWKTSITVGDEVPVYVLETPEGEEELRVSLRRGLEELDWVRAEQCLESEEAVEGQIVDHNKGGLLVTFGYLRGFVPYSHVPALKYMRDRNKVSEYAQSQVGTILPLKVIEVDRSRRRLVMSATAAEDVLRQKRLEEINEGDKIVGTVENIVDFGAFVSLNGVTGLLHISKLDWRRIKHPSEVLTIGDEIEVLVEEINAENERIALNRRALIPNPWQQVAEKYEAGDTVKGKITNIVDFGIFVRLPEGVEGLIHNSEMRSHHGEISPEDMQPGQELTVRIISIETEKERLGLSLIGTEIPEVTWDVQETETADA
jgi:small subunit ribosomal protein S1